MPIFRAVSLFAVRDRVRSRGETMSYKGTGRRDFLKHAGKQFGLMGSVAMMSRLPAFGEGLPVIEDAVQPQEPVEAPRNHIKFSVCGMSHDHIYGMVGAVQRGGGELVSAWGGE